MDTTAIVSRSYKMCILLYVEILYSMALNHGHVLMPQPNKTKPPLQVLPVVEGNSEKIRFVG
jgi:hypothetical protein